MNDDVVGRDRGDADGRSEPVAGSAPDGACMCLDFAGVRALHNFGQPGCKYASSAATPAVTR